jgi:hypothetical protein
MRDRPPAGQVEYSSDPGYDRRRGQAIAEGRSDIAAGRYLALQDIDDWIEKVSTPHGNFVHINSYLVLYTDAPP